MAGFAGILRNQSYGVTAEVVAVAKVLAAPLLLLLLWFETVIATAAMIAAAPRPMISVPLPISSWALLTPAGLPGPRDTSAAKAEEAIIVATVAAATTVLKPNI